MRMSLARRSLAEHARERMFHNEDVARTLRRLQHAQEAAAVVNSLRATFVSDLGGLSAGGFVTQHSCATPPPELTALRQRAERAERNAASWHRLAILLAVACALLLVIR